MPSTAKLHGARVYFYDDSVILVKQTVKSSKTGTYVIDTTADGSHKERHVDPGNDKALAEAIRLAGEGKL